MSNGVSHSLNHVKTEEEIVKEVINIENRKRKDRLKFFAELETIVEIGEAQNPRQKEDICSPIKRLLRRGSSKIPNSINYT